MIILSVGLLLYNGVSVAMCTELDSFEDDVIGNRDISDGVGGWNRAKSQH
jgi:hypothetical protein